RLMDSGTALLLTHPLTATHSPIAAQEHAPHGARAGTEGRQRATAPPIPSAARRATTPDDGRGSRDGRRKGTCEEARCMGRGRGTRGRHGSAPVPRRMGPIDTGAASATGGYNASTTTSPGR